MNKVSILYLLIILAFNSSCTKEVSQNKNDKIKSSKPQKVNKIETYYTCSMHPQVKEKKPGKCPICHMNLTKIEVETDDHNHKNNKSHTHSDSKTNDAGKIIGMVKLRKAQLSHFKPDFFPATKMKMTKKIRLLGSVLQSEEKESNIPARVAGRIEKVYVKSTGSFIRIGDPVVDLYSPKLITAGEEYLLAKQSYLKSKTKEFKDMLKQSEERLILWGIQRFQLKKWYKNKKIPRKITIYSPATGVVRFKRATVGKYFKEGQNFFELSDLADVWVEMDVYEHDAALIKIAQVVNLEFTSLPGELVRGEIDFISPVLDSKSRTLKIRTTIKNTTGKLKPGMVANSTLSIQMEGTPLVVPRNAIIDTGKRKVVWVKVSDKKYQAKIIHTGHESEGHVEVKHGLVENEEVVIEGSFLLDAQAQLFGGYEDMQTKE